MAPKMITVVDESGCESKEMLSNEEGYKNLVAEYRVVKDRNGARIRDFGSLVDGGKYHTLGGIPQRLERQDVTIIVKYKQFKTNWTTSNRDERNLTELEQFVRETWSSVGEAQLMFFNNNVRMTDELLAALKDASVVQVVNTQVGFSTITTFEKALKLIGCENLDRNDDAFPKEATLGDDDDKHIQQALANIRSLSGIVEFIGGCEAMRRMYIDPILCAAGLVAKAVKMKVETTVEDPQVSGPVDYLFAFKDKVICVTEGKKDQLDVGISQNIAQLFAIRNTRKRKYESISKAADFGIATTFVEWVFIKYEQGSVTASKPVVVDMYKPDSIKRIIGRIVALLRQCKEDVSPEPAESKQRRG